jgi:hypothetical protein
VLAPHARWGFRASGEGEVRPGFGRGGISGPSPPPPIFIEYANGLPGRRPISNPNLYGLISDGSLIQIVMIASLGTSPTISHLH